MPIKCGNCKQHHPTALAVRSCYGHAGSSRTGQTGQTGQNTAEMLDSTAGSSTRQDVDRAFSGRTGPNLATTKQINLIVDLLSGLTPLEPAQLPDYQADVRSMASGLNKQAASVLIDRLLRDKAEADAKAEDIEVHSVLKPGTYTVVLDGDDDRVTIRVDSATWAKDLPAGSLAVYYLSGADNEYDYTGFAFIVKGRPRVWSKFRDNGRLTAALHYLVNGDNMDEAHERFLNLAEAYALESSNCLRCLRKLTVPASVHRGLGPVCARIEGVA